MDPHSISRIRNASFGHAVRGYDRHEVDQFLRELADWLERDGAGAAASEQVRAELERTGEQVAGILTEAHDAAQEIRDEATVSARQSLVKANATAESLRAEADEYADKAREEADAYSRKTRAEADAYVERTREEADSAAAESREEAGREAERIVEEANRRKRDIEAVISDLDQRRDVVLVELERLASGLAGTATEHRGRGAAEPDAGDGGERGDDDAAGEAETAEQPSDTKAPAASSRSAHE